MIPSLLPYPDVVAYAEQTLGRFTRVRQILSRAANRSRPQDGLSGAKPILLGRRFKAPFQLPTHRRCGGRDRARRAPLTPRDAKRAIDYIEANLDTEIGLPEIVAACGVPGRTLIEHFREFKGTSPMRYLRSARFEKVREALAQAEPDESVTEIALRWGFTHLGRFSVEYRKRFGESPSQTLRRRNAMILAADLPPPAAPARAGPWKLD
jgi:AraC-like DNA-binding protein